MTEPLRLEIEVREDSVALTVLNPSGEPARVWERSNSWGWPTTVLTVAPVDRPSAAVALRPGPQEFTRNVPSFVEIPPGARHTFSLRPTDGSWVVDGSLDPLLAVPVQIQGRLSIPPSPEARNLRVFVGQIESAPVSSAPPHRWLVATG